MDDDLDIWLGKSDDGSEITIKLKHPKAQRITLAQMIMELEMYILELERARAALVSQTPESFH